MMEYVKTFDDLLASVLDEDLTIKEKACVKIVHVAKRIKPISSMLVAKARNDNFTQGENVDVAKWINWCRKHLLLEGNELHHRRAIGDMLLFTQEQYSALFEELFVLDCNKLLSLTRIPKTEIKAFLSLNDIDKMDRDVVRDAVKNWLKEDTKANVAKQMTLPGFDDVLKSVEKLNINSIYDAINDRNIADKSLHAGFTFVGASIEYLKRNRDFHALKIAKESLLSEIMDIEQAMKECSM